MKLDMNRLSIAVSLALTAGALGLAGPLHASEATQDAAEAIQSTPPATAQAQNLKGVVVTGSLIRRVDIETASPVVTLDRATISASGKPVLGDVLQALPSISGNATNPQNNSNGGGGATPAGEAGDGASRVSLRGLGVERTLVLVNGQRMANPDVNLIPTDMIERTDVLAEGASTVYGSDAIGGVVNFILRKDFQGAQLSVNGGISGHGDAERRGMTLTAGSTGDRYSIVGGVDFNKYDPVLNPARKFAAQVLYLSGGVITPSGSSSIPNGRIQLPGSFASRYGCAVNSSGTMYVTRDKGDGSSLDDYRCYRGASDNYNYAVSNYLQTAQKRTNGFVLGSYNITDNTTAFVDAFYNHTVSSGQDASTPYGTSPLFSISASNPINPFGVTFSQNPIPGDPNSGYRFQTRLTGIGPRIHLFTTDTGQINTGLRGNFGQESSWIWDASINYSHTKRNMVEPVVMVASKMQAAVDAGANIFNQGDPTVSKQFEAAREPSQYVLTRATKQAQVDASGELWTLPAGAVQLSVGTLFRKQSMNYTVSPDSILDPATMTCNSGGCQSPGRGSYNVKELFSEALIPLLSNQPFAHTLNLDLGIRTSDYSTTGTTTNKKIAIEWRPIADLLVRGTISEVFRAPNLNMLYDGLSTGGGGAALNDPCAHRTAAELAQHANACRFVPPDWAGNSILQVTGRYSGAIAAGAKLKPEHGKSVNFGLVYDPEFIPGLSTSVDFWHIYLFDTLTTIQTDTVVNACYNNNASPYCGFIVRYDDTTRQPGQIYYVNTPAVNLGSLSTSGIDYTLRYKLPHFNLGNVDPGNFRLGLATSYVATYKNSATPGQPGAKSIDYAGTFSQQFGNIARWRGTATVNWEKGNWNAQWQTRYVHRLTLHNGDAAIPGVDIPMASVLYNSIQLGYAIPKIRTRFDIGVDNLNDRQPPLIYQNSNLNTNNTDGATYDLLGRYYWARATVKF